MQVIGEDDPDARALADRDRGHAIEKTIEYARRGLTQALRHPVPDLDGRVIPEAAVPISDLRQSAYGADRQAGAEDRGVMAIDLVVQADITNLAQRRNRLIQWNGIGPQTGNNDAVEGNG